VAEDRLESGRYLVKFDANGDVSGVYDKEAGAELLRGPATVELLDNKFTELWDDKYVDWPAWEIKWETLNRPPAARLSAPSVKVVERGPVRATLEITRGVKGSTFVQRVSLTEGGDRVDFDTQVDWKTPGMLVKAAFPLRASNPKATYDPRPRHDRARQQSREPLRSAGAAVGGHHRRGWLARGEHSERQQVRMGQAWRQHPAPDVAAHAGGQQAVRISGDERHRPPSLHLLDSRAQIRLAGGPHPRARGEAQSAAPSLSDRGARGPLGRSFSMLRLSNDGEGQIAVRAFKKAEDSEEIVLRLQELYGRPARAVEVALADDISAVREINAAEEETSSPGPSRLGDGRLIVNLGAYRPRSFALKTRGAPAEETARRRAPPSLCHSTSMGSRPALIVVTEILTAGDAVSPRNCCRRPSQ
jgi:alpha-mannosidase